MTRSDIDAPLFRIARPPGARTGLTAAELDSVDAALRGWLAL